jgi:hypothetical protein
MVHVPFINSYYHLFLKAKKVASCRASKAMTLAKLKLGPRSGSNFPHAVGH